MDDMAAEHERRLQDLQGELVAFDE